MSVEANFFESDINECICKSQTVIKESMLAKASQSVHVSKSVNVEVKSRLKPLKLPVATS